MKRLSAAVLIWLGLTSAALAQSQVRTVTACGGLSLPANVLGTMYMDLTGNLCTNAATTGGGGGVVTQPTASLLNATVTQGPAGASAWPISVASLPLPAGAATAANQAGQNLFFPNSAVPYNNASLTTQITVNLSTIGTPAAVMIQNIGNNVANFAFSTENTYPVTTTTGTQIQANSIVCLGVPSGATSFSVLGNGGVTGVNIHGGTGTCTNTGDGAGAAVGPTSVAIPGAAILDGMSNSGILQPIIGGANGQQVDCLIASVLCGANGLSGIITALGNPVPLNQGTGLFTNKTVGTSSGAIVTAAAATAYLMFINVSPTAVICIIEGAGPATITGTACAAGEIPLYPNGGHFSMENSTVSTSAWQAIASATNTPLTVGVK